MISRYKPIFEIKSLKEDLIYNYFDSSNKWDTQPSYQDFVKRTLKHVDFRKLPEEVQIEISKLPKVQLKQFRVDERTNIIDSSTDKIIDEKHKLLQNPFLLISPRGGSLPAVVLINTEGYTYVRYAVALKSFI